MEQRNEIAIIQTQVSKIEFEGYERMLDEVGKLSEAMQHTEVTEKTLQENKKLLAEVRAKVRALDKERILVKNQVLEPYDELNAKIQEIKDLLAVGENHINDQLRQYTLAQREARRLEIKQLFERYRESYNAPHWLSFEKFISKNPTLVTNKSTSNKTIRTKIVEYFEQFKSDYAELKIEVPDKNTRSAVLIAYSKNGLDMPGAITEYKAMIAEKERLEAEQARVKANKVPDIVILTPGESVPVEEKPEVQYSVVVSEKSLSAMKAHGIEFKMVGTQA